MMRVPEKIYIECNKCKCEVIVESESFDCETCVSERKMGDEIEYTFHAEICCEECDSWINVTIRGWEYPVGAFEFSECECCGGTFIDEATAEINYELDEEYLDEIYLEYMAVEYALKYQKAQIENMSSRDFEIFVADIFEGLGYSVKITQATRDGGKDIIATKSGPIPHTLIVECKHWAERHKVGVGVVRKVYGVQIAERANQSVIVTSSKFTKDARKFAEEQKTLLTLWDIDDLLKYTVCPE